MKSGYTFNLEYEPPAQNVAKAKRRRNILWFNPPFSETVKTNIGKQFFLILAECFPKENPLSKIFNKNTVKLSYSCTPNFKSHINRNNKKVIKIQDAQQDTCECRNDVCPVQGKCGQSEVVYRAEVKQLDNDVVDTYTGCTKQKFRKRYNQHKQSFNNHKYWDATSLSVYIWELKKRNIRFKLTWKIIGRAKSYNPTSQVCNLCNLEKYFILYEPQGANLNKRDEMFNFCKHRPLYCLANQT